MRIYLILKEFAREGFKRVENVHRTTLKAKSAQGYLQTSVPESNNKSGKCCATAPSGDFPFDGASRQQSENRQFRLRTDVHLAVCDGGHAEFDRVAGSVGRADSCIAAIKLST